MDGNIRLKTAIERRKDIHRELDLLDRQAQDALIEYQRKLREIKQKRQRLWNQLQRIKI